VRPVLFENKPKCCQVREVDDDDDDDDDNNNNNNICRTPLMIEPDLVVKLLRC